MYDYNWYVGLVEDVCEEEGDVRVSFMHPKGGRPKNCFFCPPRGEICHIPKVKSDSEFKADRIELRN